MLIVQRSRNPLMRARAALRSTYGTVFVLRHGSTDRNRGGVGEDLIRGHSDLPLTEAGESEVLVTARIIAADKIRRIYSSDMVRAVRSAEIISDENDGYPNIDESAALRSWDMGPSMEGQVTTPDVVGRIRDWVVADSTVPPGGESFRAFASRLLGYVGPIFAETLEHGDTCAIMAHGRCCQVIDFWVAAGCDENCMHREFSEYLAEEPDTVPPGGGLRFKNDGIGWLGVVINTGVPSLGTQIAAGSHVRPANEMAARRGGGLAS